MFSGTYRYRVDAKGRLAIPARFREDLKGAHLSIGPDRILSIYPPEQFTRLGEHVPPPWMATEEQRQFSRTVYPLAMPCDFDSQGRVTLSLDQRRLAGIEPNSSVAVIGNGTVVEIWPEDRWDSYSAGAQPRFTELVNKVSKA